MYFPRNPLFSAALCRGLIEATTRRSPSPRRSRRFPRLYVAASLKHTAPFVEIPRALGFPRLYVAASLKHCSSVAKSLARATFSAALCRGLIEAPGWPRTIPSNRSFSAALCRGLIEACPSPPPWRSSPPRFPRLYVAASLKRRPLPLAAPARRAFSAALCRGLIEAEHQSAHAPANGQVFRGFMSRPH